VTQVEDQEMDLIALDFQNDEDIEYPEIRKKELEKVSCIYSPSSEHFEYEEYFDHDCIHTRTALSHVEKDHFDDTIHAKRVQLTEYQKSEYTQSKKDSKVIAKYLSELFHKY